LATVITNLFSAIPFIGQDIVLFIWGGFTVSNPTIQRFFALHYLLPFILAALVVMHFMALHIHGSSNPVGISGNMDRIPMHSYFVFKDLVTVFVFIIIFSLFVFFSPNTLGHSDNYIPGNPMVTPPSIAIIIIYYIYLCIYIVKFKVKDFCVKNYFFNILLNFNINSDHKKCDDNILDIDYNNLTKEDISILLDNNINRIDEKYNKEDIKFLLNGLFQSEGHIGGYFESKESVTFNPLVFISQNINKETIKLFKIMNKEFDNQLLYYIYKTKTNIWHIKIFTKNWNIIINKWIPYFNNTYGDKYIGLQLLCKIYYLHNSKYGKINKHTLLSFEHVDNAIKRVYLVYNLIDNSKRFISKEDKIKLFLNYKDIYKDNIDKINFDYYNKYIITIKSLYNDKCINNFKINFLFIHGLFLGDGSFYIRIRNSNNLPWYVPIYRITQKMTIYNEDLFNIIIKYLKDYNINPNIKKEKYNDSKDRSKPSMIILYIDTQKDIKNYAKLLLKYPNYYYFKSNQIYFMLQACKLFGKIKVWREGYIALLKLIYNYKLGNIYNLPNYNYIKANKNILTEYNKNLNLINSKFDKDIHDLYYISIYKNKSYVVNLPITSKSKYFTFNSNKDNALIQAKLYRNNTLKQWLKDNNFIYIFKI
jgi:hypothetical protein